VNQFFLLSDFLLHQFFKVLATSSWFVSSNGSNNLTILDNYTTSSTTKYLGLMIGIGVFGTVLNLLPAVDRYSVRLITELEAADKLADKSTSLHREIRSTTFPPTCLTMLSRNAAGRRSAPKLIGRGYRSTAPWLLERMVGRFKLSWLIAMMSTTIIQ